MEPELEELLDEDEELDEDELLDELLEELLVDELLLDELDEDELLDELPPEDVVPPPHPTKRRLPARTLPSRMGNLLNRYIYFNLRSLFI